MLDPMSLAFKDGVSLPMTHARGVVSRDRRGSRTPCLAGRFIAQVNHFRGRIDDRIVAPASQSIRLAVASPGESRPTLGDEETERGIGDHVDPGAGGNTGYGVVWGFGWPLSGPE